MNSKFALQRLMISELFSVVVVVVVVFFYQWTLVSYIVGGYEQQVGVFKVAVSLGQNWHTRGTQFFKAAWQIPWRETHV